MTGRLYLLASIALLATNAATAQQDIIIEDGVTWLASAQHEDPSALDPLDGLAPPNGDEVFDVLYRSVRYRLAHDTVTRESFRIYRFNDEESIRDYGTLRSGYDAASDTIAITRAMVVDSAGEMHVVDPATVQVVADDSFNVFSDYRNIVIPMTGIDVGSIAVIADVVTTDRSKDIAPWGAVLYEQYGVPIGKLDLVIEWDAPELRPNWNSQIEGMNCSESDAGALHCSLVDIPAYEIEVDVFYDDVTPQFVAAEAMSWEQLAGWYKPVFESAVSGDPSVVAKSAELAAGLDDETEVLRAMHEFVSKQVRYVGLEHGSWAYRPHDTATTLARRYGDCKDKSALLVDLLRQQGIDMSPVLVATTRKDAGKLVVPSSSYFDHLIVCGELGNGRQYCLDATDPYSGIDQLSDWTQGAAALHVDQASGPFTLPADDYSMAFREELDLVLTENGDLEESGTVYYQGAYASNIRAHLVGMTSDELDEWALADYHDAVSSLVDPEFRIDGIDENNRDLEVSWTATYESLVSQDQDLEYAEYASWLNQAIGFMFTENEHYSYLFPGLRFDSVVTFTLDSRWRVDQWSPQIDMQSRFGRFERTIDQKGSKVTLRSRFEAPKALIPVEEIQDFTTFLEIIQQESSWSVDGVLRD